VITTPCVGDVDGDGDPDLVFRTQNGTIYAFHRDGGEVIDGDDDPATLGVVRLGSTSAFITRAQIILSDLDGDGALDIATEPRRTPLGSLLLTVSISGGAVITRDTMGARPRRRPRRPTWTATAAPS
jgi:hypothetical protein